MFGYLQLIDLFRVEARKKTEAAPPAPAKAKVPPARAPAQRPATPPPNDGSRHFRPRANRAGQSGGVGLVSRQIQR